MAKQLLIYESAIPVQVARHRDVCVDVSANYSFSAGLNAVPVLAVEFLRAATEYVVVFAEVDGIFMPVVLLGLRGQENLYLGADGTWRARYVPAFLRRYPFVLAQAREPGRLTLCIDEASPALNREGRGQALFGSEGQTSAYLEQMLDFLKQYQGHFARTQAFGRKLKELEVLEPTRAQVTAPDGTRLALTGFFVATRRRLRALTPEALSSLARTDELELLYLHLHSLRHLGDMKDRLAQHDDDMEDAPALSEAGADAAAMH
jgi:hypothetical protein